MGCGCGRRGGPVASWLVRSFLGRSVQVRALAREMSLRSWAHALYSHSAFFPQGI